MFSPSINTENNALDYPKWMKLLYYYNDTIMLIKIKVSTFSLTYNVKYSGYI